MLEHSSALLRSSALAHAVLAVAFGLWLFVEASPIESHHPGWKPFKFALSIAIFLITMAWLVPSLSVGARVRVIIEWLLAGTMTVEMIAIGLQALRGRTSHFNDGSPFDTLVWRVMMVAIVVTSLTMLGVALIATLRPLLDGAGSSMNPLLASAWRGGLWLFLFVPLSGFTMGGRMTRYVGGASEEGLPILHWSTAQGDFRVAHFFALHAIQVLVLLAIGLEALNLRESIGRSIVWVATALGIVLIGHTYLQARSGRPLVRRVQAQEAGDGGLAPMESGVCDDTPLGSRDDRA